MIREDWSGARIAIFLMPGLGDALVASPIIRGFHEARAAVDAITMLSSVSEYARDLSAVANVLEIPFLQGSVSRLWTGLGGLRRKRYDAAVVPFPATRWQYAAVAAVARADRLIIHNYGGASAAISRARRATLVPLAGGHRIWENARLAEWCQLGAQPAEYLVPASWRAASREDEVGIHPGTMAYKGNEVRRWPLTRYGELARALVRQGRRVAFFVGPNEPDAARIGEEIEGVDVVRTPLVQAAARVSQCAAFVGNDAGMTHVAAGLGVPTVAIFGMTDPVRAAPIGPSIVVRPTSCPPCHDEGLRTFSCTKQLGYRCISDDITLDIVLEAVARALAHGSEHFRGAVTSPFRLYGVAHDG